MAPPSSQLYNSALCRVVNTNDFYTVPDVRFCEHYSREWLTGNWPPHVMYTDDAGEDHLLTIVFIGRPNECIRHRDEIIEREQQEAAAARARREQQRAAAAEEFDVERLTRRLEAMDQRMNAIENIAAHAVDREDVYRVGRTRFPVRVALLVESALVGMNANGFLHLLGRLFPEQFIEDPSTHWMGLSTERQDLILELLGAFVLAGHNDQPGVTIAQRAVVRNRIYHQMLGTLNGRRFRYLNPTYAKDRNASFDNDDDADAKSTKSKSSKATASTSGSGRKRGRPRKSDKRAPKTVFDENEWPAMEEATGDEDDVRRVKAVIDKESDLRKNRPKTKITIEDDDEADDAEPDDPAERNPGNKKPRGPHGRRDPPGGGSACGMVY